MKKTEKLTM